MKASLLQNWRNPLPALLVVPLILLPLAVLLMIANPRVSERYRAYFIERSTSCWPRQVSGFLAPGEQVSFIDAEESEAAARLKLCGWIEATSFGTFSIGPEARLLINPAATVRPLQLEIDLLPYVTAAHPVQRVKLFANGQHLAELLLDESSGPRHKIDVPSSLVAGDGTLELALYMPDAVSPRSLGLSDDRRLLGVRLLAIRLLPT